MGFWLYPQPEAYFSGTVMVPKHDDIHALVDTLALLLNAGVVQGTTSVLNTASFGPPDPELARIRVGSSTSDLERYMAQKGLGYWTVDLPFYGPAKVIAAPSEHAKEKFSTYSRRAVPRRSVVPLSTEPGGARENSQPCPARHSKSHDVCDRRTFQSGAHVVLADHPDDRRRGHRSDAVSSSRSTKISATPTGALPGLPISSFFARAFVIIYFFPI